MAFKRAELGELVKQGIGQRNDWAYSTRLNWRPHPPLRSADLWRGAWLRHAYFLGGALLFFKIFVHFCATSAACAAKSCSAVTYRWYKEPAFSLTV